MPIRDDMREAMVALGPVKPPNKRFILMGKDCRHAFMADSRSEGVDDIDNFGGFPIVETDSFPGWEIVDKPNVAAIGRGAPRS